MQPDNEDEAWRSIIENYGDRPRIDDPPTEPPTTAVPAAPFGGRFGDPQALGDPAPDADDPSQLAEDERFEPPPPPPLPRVAPDRLLAWTGIFGSPAVLIAALIFSVSVPAVAAYLLVAAFVGGFIYLVAKMPRGPRDPWDDGAQL